MPDRTGQHLDPRHGHLPEVVAEAFARASTSAAARAPLPAAEEFDHYARLVRRLLGVPVGLVTIVEADRQVFPGAVGLPEPWQQARQTPLSHSFCQHVVADERPLLVSDARSDPRLADNAAIDDLGVVAYAGFPIVDLSGTTVGSLCAIDSTPRAWTPEEIEVLRDLAVACSAEWVQRTQARQTAEALALAEHLGERRRVLLGLAASLSFTETLADVAAAVAQAAAETLGCVRTGMWLRDPDLVAREVSGPTADRSARRLPERMRFVEAVDPGWRSTTTFPVVPLDASTPLGAVVADGAALFYATRAEQAGAWPQPVDLDEPGEARAYVPLVSSAHAYGGIVLVWPDARQFGDEDRMVVAALAGYTAMAVRRAQLFQERVDVSTELQHAMLTELPEPGHLELAARYLPARVREQVGGDWYDAVLVPDGTTHLMIGDVEGHDIAAATVMGQLRSMLRMAAWMSPGPPSAVLTLLDRAVHDLGVPKLTSAVLARVERTDEPGGALRLRWSNAGHLPPLLVAPDGSVRYLGHDPVTREVGDGEPGDGDQDDRPDPQLGIAPEVVRHDHAVLVDPGSLVLLYTDGLVERRGEVLDVSLERLRRTAERAAHLAPDAFLDHVLAELLDREHEDDVAVLAVRCSELPQLS